MKTSLKDRLKWLRKLRGIKSKKDAAAAMDITFGAYQRWEYSGTPNRKNFKKIVNFYGCSLFWLMEGQGEPFPGARKKYPEVCGPEEYKSNDISAATVNEPLVEYGVKISEALTMASRVLESGTSYATALYLNIQHFDRAIRAEERIPQVESKIDALEKKVEELSSEDSPGTGGDPGTGENASLGEKKAI